MSDTAESTEQDPLLEECPECGGDELVTADEVNDVLWSDEDTACLNCQYVWDGHGRFNGGFNNDVSGTLSRTARGDTDD